MIWSSGRHDVFDGGDGTDILSLPGRWHKQSLLDHLILTSIEVLSVYREIKIRHVDLSQFTSISGTGTLGQKDVMGSTIRFSAQATFDDEVNFSYGNWLLLGSKDNDVFDVSQSACSFTIHGGDGDDSIVGNYRANLLYGQAGNDTLTGGMKNDTIDGGGDNDTVQAGDGRNRITDDRGDNTLHGGDGNDFILAKGTNHLYGDGGNDTLMQTGSGYVDAGDGDDTITLSHEHFHPMMWTVIGGAGDDTLSASRDLSGLHCEGVEVLETGRKLIIAEDTLDSFEKIEKSLISHIFFSSGGHFTWKHETHEQQGRTDVIGSSE